MFIVKRRLVVRKSGTFYVFQVFPKFKGLWQKIHRVNFDKIHSYSLNILNNFGET